jgi:hypothetical protein
MEQRMTGKSTCMLGCDAPQHSRGLCSACYQAARRLVQTKHFTWHKLAAAGVCTAKGLHPISAEKAKFLQEITPVQASRPTNPIINGAAVQILFPHQRQAMADCGHNTEVSEPIERPHLVDREFDHESLPAWAKSNTGEPDA